MSLKSAAMTVSALLGAALFPVLPYGVAQATDGCPDIDVIFSRGTGESPGIGVTGQAFVTAVKERVEGMSVHVTPSVFPAVQHFPDSASGVADVREKIQSRAQTCPDTKIVVGGFSRGAEITSLALSDKLPTWMKDIPALPTSAASHVTAVVLMGKPSGRYLDVISAPASVLGHLYVLKAISLCANDDPICSDGEDVTVHKSYSKNGMVDTAVNFTCGRLLSTAQTVEPAAPQAPYPLPSPTRSGG